jgi:hypothetical protein
MKCIDCNSQRVSEPDHEGFIDCFDCGAAWIPGVAAELPGMWDKSDTEDTSK